MTLGDVDGIAKGHFLWADRKRHPETGAPQHYQFTTAWKRSQHGMFGKVRILCFIPNLWVRFVRNPLLKKWWKHGILMVRKKVIPDMVIHPPAGLFPSSVLHKYQTQVSWRTWMLRKRFQPNPKSPADFQKARLPNDWTQDRTGMTPDRRIGGHFYWLRRNRPRPGAPGQQPGREQKIGPEKSAPTQISYHKRLPESTAKCCPGSRICSLHKSGCLYLGNIPSWKVGKGVLLYSHKEEIQKQ